MNDNEFVLNKNADGTYKGGGYDINSILLHEGISPIITYNDTYNDTHNDNMSSANVQHGGGCANVNLVSKMFNNLAVPAGLLYLQQSIKPTNKLLKIQSNNIIDNTLYDKLVSLVHSSRKNKYNNKTRKKNKIRKSKTRKLKMIK
jgi:hypothetical protein